MIRRAVLFALWVVTIATQAIGQSRSGGGVFELIPCADGASCNAADLDRFDPYSRASSLIKLLPYGSSSSAGSALDIIGHVFYEVFVTNRTTSQFAIVGVDTDTGDITTSFPSAGYQNLQFDPTTGLLPGVIPCIDGTLCRASELDSIDPDTGVPSQLARLPYGSLQSGGSALDTVNHVFCEVFVDRTGLLAQQQPPKSNLAILREVIDICGSVYNAGYMTSQKRAVFAKEGPQGSVSDLLVHNVKRVSNYFTPRRGDRRGDWFRELFSQGPLCPTESLCAQAALGCIATVEVRVKTDQVRVHSDFEQRINALLLQLDVSSGVVLTEDKASHKPADPFWRTLIALVGLFLSILLTLTNFLRHIAETSPYTDRSSVTENPDERVSGKDSSSITRHP